MKKKHPENCQFCLWELTPYSTWAGDPTYLAEMEQKHYKEHCDECPTCGKSYEEYKWSTQFN